MMSKAKDGRQLLFKHFRVLAKFPSRYLKSQRDQINGQEQDEEEQDEEEKGLPRRVASQGIRIVLLRSRSCPLQGVHWKYISL